MKNKILILGLGIILAYTSVSFAGENEASNDPLGSVSAFKREFVLNIDACARNIKRDRDGWIQCEADIFPKSDEEIKVSTSLDGLPYHEIRSEVPAKGSLSIGIQPFGYGIYQTGGFSSGENITDEEFLGAAQKLISKFKKGHVKLLKIVK